MNDPARFNEVILGRAPYWERQRDVCEAVVKHRVTVVPTGNAVGKTFLAAGLILWWAYTRFGSLSITTAPSQMLLGSVLFKEIRKAYHNSLIPLGGSITESAHASPQLLTVDADGWGCLGVSTRGVERLSGHHAADLLVVVDEASGVDPEIMEAVWSLNAAKIILFGNPIRPDGMFKSLHERAEREKQDPAIAESDRCVSIRIPSTESPDRDLDRSPRGLADRGFLLEAEATYGRDSMWWRSHVGAEFPEASHDTLLPTWWVDRCTLVARSTTHMPGRRRMGVDLGAGSGRDRTVILVRDDLGILDLVTSKYIGVPQAAIEIARKARAWGVRDEDITFDAGGPAKELPVYLAQSGIHEPSRYLGATSGGARFGNRRSRVGWALRCRLDPERPLPEAQKEVDRLHLPRSSALAVPEPPKVQAAFVIDPQEWWGSLREEMINLRYTMVGSKISLEPKEQLMKRIGRSPDLVDALIMSFDCPEGI